MGIESGNEDILKEYKYGLTLKQIKDAIAIFKEAKIRVLGYFLIGFPQESVDSIRQTIDFACTLNIDAVNFNVPSPVPGTALWDQCDGDTNLITRAGHDRSGGVMSLSAC